MHKIMQQDQLDLNRQHQQSKQLAILYIQSQLALTVAISIALLFIDLVMAYSALTGGMIATVANAWFAFKVFRVRPDSAAVTMLASAYTGEMYKIMLTGALFLCAFVLIRPVSAVALLITYFLVHMAPIVVSVVQDRAGNGASDKN